ncbi:MAG: hypothetical protein LBF27_01855 [Sphingobacterium sp.]|jgi:hypothetical protein|nr:hypothetical protein [Sphingobacterium sp.]
MDYIENFTSEDFALDVQTIGIVEPVSFTTADSDEVLATIRTITSSRII